jgi:hypothetical protein
MSSKLQDLPAVTSVAPTDIVYTVTTPGTTPADKQITTANLKKRAVTNKSSSYPLVTDDLGTVLTMNSGSTQVFTLPVLSSTDIGKQVMFIKLGAGQLTIQAGTGQTIADSSSAGTAYDDQAGETYASLTLVAITTTQWIILGFDGTWTTT